MILGPRIYVGEGDFSSLSGWPHPTLRAHGARKNGPVRSGSAQQQPLSIYIFLILIEFSQLIIVCKCLYNWVPL